MGRYELSAAGRAGDRNARPELSIELTILAASVFLVAFSNVPFWHDALAGQSFAQAHTWRFAVSTFVVLVALHFILIGLFATRRTLRPLLAILIPLSLAAEHYVRSYGIVLDPSMMRNVLNTDLREAQELIGATLVRVLIAGLVVASLLWTIRIRRLRSTTALLARIGALGAAFLIGTGALLVAYHDLGSLMRSDRGLRYKIIPANFLWSVARALTLDSADVDAHPRPPEPASRRLAISAHRKPILFVLVVGETARAANFSLNGYPRPTNPELAGFELLNFKRTTACGTSTEVSLPCMFSPFGRADYDERRIRRHESLLHILARAGMRVVWLDNQSGCKGVCDGLEFRDVSRERVPGLCGEGYCYDEILLHSLARIADSPGQDTVVVLHQIGNHGPAYYRRYPPETKHFQPACENQELRNCTREQIVNAYDNAIAYTDRFLARTIRYLQERQAHFEVAMIYVSDHGESLGELGLYLHGIPYALAPKEQLEIPMLWWLPAASAGGLGIDVDCIRRRTDDPASHDNLFHSVLGLLAVVTPRYDRTRDLFDGCRSIS